MEVGWKKFIFPCKQWWIGMWQLDSKLHQQVCYLLFQAEEGIGFECLQENFTLSVPQQIYCL